MSVPKLTNNLSADLIRIKFDYDQSSGVLSYSGRERSHLSPSQRSRRTGKPAGWPDTHGHLNIKIGRADYLLHRVIWLHQHGIWPTGVIDHIDGDKKNNRLSNLRLTDQSRNCQNVKSCYSNNKSGVLGVTKGYTDGTWAVNIRVNSKGIHLGTYHDKDFASKVYLNAKFLVHPDSPVVSGHPFNFSDLGAVAVKNLAKAGYLQLKEFQASS